MFVFGVGVVVCFVDVVWIESRREEVFERKIKVSFLEGGGVGCWVSKSSGCLL